MPVSTYRRPQELVAACRPDRLVPELVRNLAEALGGRVAFCAPVGAQNAGLVVRAAWPEDAAVPGGPAGLEGEVARQPVRGGGMVLVAAPRQWGDGEHAALRETAGWLGVAARLDELRMARDAAESRAHGLRTQVAVARERLADVRELERHRLVRAITATTLADLAEIRGRLERLTGLPWDGGDRMAGELAVVRDALDEVLDDFRTVARGVYPAMLPERGPQAALEELAATLPRPVRFTGELGRRVEWQVESGLYHAVAAALNALAGKEFGAVSSAVTVTFRRDDALRVRLDAPAEGLTGAGLRAVLRDDVERLAVVGGVLEHAVLDDRAVVSIRLAERLELPEIEAPPPALEHNALYRRVRELLRQGQRAARTAEDRQSWAAVARRLAQPPRLAVVRDPSAGPEAVPGADRAAALGVTVIDAEGPADWALAQEFLVGEGLRGSIDAVLCCLPPEPAFRSALRAARQRVELSESANLVELAGKLATWGPVIAARRALVAVRDLIVRLPADHPVRWSADRIGIEAHEIAELDLLDEFEHGDPRLLHSVGRETTAAAMRLLGARGRDPLSRLGLSADAGAEEIRDAAVRAVRVWRSYADRPTTSAGRDRAACEVLVRTAEALLNRHESADQS